MAAMKNFVLLACCVALLAAGCTVAEPAEPRPAAARVTAAWQAGQHTVWELYWPAAPVGGPVTVESWQADGRYRYEILETAAPGLLGETLAFDGRTAYRYNRLNPPAEFTPSEPHMSPVSDAFARISAQLAQPAIAATGQPAQLNGRPVWHINLTFAGGATLAAWLDESTGLLAQIEVAGGNGDLMRLHARTAAPLPDPAPELFTVGPWAGNHQE
ncbi:MAG: hypothetical protein Kow0031_19100 [Anaerolineae bacterium]